MNAPTVAAVSGTCTEIITHSQVWSCVCQNVTSHRQYTITPVSAGLTSPIRVRVCPCVSVSLPLTAGQKGMVKLFISVQSMSGIIPWLGGQLGTSVPTFHILFLLSISDPARIRL
jgi:hypothetical protein